MNFSLFSGLSKIERRSRPLWRRLGGRLNFQVICLASVFLLAHSLHATNSQFPNVPLSGTGANSSYSAQKAAVLSANVTNTMAAKVASTNSVESTNAMDVLDDKYPLAVGDTVNFQVVEDEDDPKTITVTDSGDVEIPLIGRFPAKGKTCKQLAQQLKKELEKKYYYQATVIVSVNSMVSKGVIYLVGGVRTPGPLELPRDDVLTISKAVLRAGGFDDFADQSHVRVTRKGGGGTNEIFTVDVSAILDKSKAVEDPQVEPGDLIYIPEKTFRF